jgi:hypothetical protein
MGFLKQHLGWKLLSLFLAAVAWVFYVGDPQLASSIQVPLQYRNLPLDLEISSDLPQNVNLDVRGTSGRLTAFDASGSPVILDFRGVDGAGERTFNLTRDEIQLPMGVQLMRAVPSQVRIRFEPRASREVPVEIRYASPPPDGYRVSSQSVRPQFLRIVGPKSRVEMIEAAEADPIDLIGVYDYKTFRVSTYVSDPQVRFDGTPQVVVQVRMEKTAEAAPPPATAPRGQRKR